MSLDALACRGSVLKSTVKINLIVFADAMRNLLINTRVKNFNFMIVGCAKCSKSFVFSALQSIYKIFTNPTNDKYALVGNVVIILHYISY